MTPISAANAAPIQNATTPLTNNVNGPDATTSPDLNSGLDYLDQLPGLVDGMKKNVIDVYAKVMQKYTDYVNQLAELKSAITAASKPGQNSGMINVDFNAITQKIGDIEKNFSFDNPIFVSQKTGAEGEAEARRWAEELGLDPDKVVIPSGDKDSTYQINVDLTPLKTIGTTVTSVGGGGENGIVKKDIDANRYQALISAVDGQIQTPFNQVQVIGEKFGRQNTQMNSLFQFVTGAASQLTQTLSTMWR